MSERKSKTSKPSLKQAVTTGHETVKKTGDLSALETLSEALRIVREREERDS